MKKLTFALLMATSNMCMALNDFKCTIKDAIYLEDSGTLNHKSQIVIGYIGKEFLVNRATGIITGAKINNTMSGQPPVVYDYLPQENAYKAITHYKPNHTIDYLKINQYSKNSQKPFFFLGAFGTMLSGTCIKY